MNEMKPNKAKNIHNQVLQMLKDEIVQMQAGQNRILSEGDLSQRLQISRTTVREVLQILSSETVLTKRHGKGTFAHPSAMRLPHRIDLSSNFRNLLDDEHSAITFETISGVFAPCCTHMKEHFPQACETVYRTEELYTQNHVAKIFCRNSIPEQLIINPPVPGEFHNSLASWMEQHCDIDSAYFAVSITCTADEQANLALGLPATQVIQNWREILYDVYDRPVAFCDIFFHPEHVNLSMALRF